MYIVADLVSLRKITYLIRHSPFPLQALLISFGQWHVCLLYLRVQLFEHGHDNYGILL